ncbi:unnamed protein product [Haemonchus placei]|uniref:Nidogen n=1 Tax=Haemonchus placei TaxID=6290 RepID=A0A0N4WPN0_HAEPC|nr:unnamed protein product [Haemonchus placei]
MIFLLYCATIFIISVLLCPSMLGKPIEELTTADLLACAIKITKISDENMIFTIFQIHSSGYVSFSPNELQPSALPVSEPVLATYWMPTEGATVYYRETDDLSIVNLAHNEVNIQYRYGSKFRVKSVLIITWEGGRPENSDSEGNLFQLALIIGDSMTFAHFVYSKLNSNDNAVAGFSSMNSSYSLPDSATHDAMLLSEKSDIGIPGEWLFRIDGVQVHLCGAGFKGLECIDSCAASQWFNDCSRSCHCDGGDPCDQETGRCPNGRCSPGWKGAPICDEDEDECEKGDICPSAQPDCMNTPGSYLCICFEYDEQNKRCSKPPGSSEEKIPVEVVPLQPSFARATPSTKASVVRNRFQSTTPYTVPSTTTTQLITVSEFFYNNRSLAKYPLETTCTAYPKKGSNPKNVIQRLRLTKNHYVYQKLDESDYNSRCVDVNECAEGAVCGSHSECVNRPGSYDCVCEKGYRFENDECVDINECRETSPCGDNLGVECVNRPGSYECRCMDGFDGDPRRGCSGQSSQFLHILALCHDSDLNGMADQFSNLPTPTATFLRGSGTFLSETILYPIANDSIVIPRKADALATINLPSPVFVFGKPYSKVYLSSNGVLSFDRPLPGLIERAESLHEAAVFALHVQYDYAREGLVAYTYINESDMSAYSLLSRSSIGVQNNFRLTNFRTKTLHLFTFDRMRQAGSENFESHLKPTQSDEATMLTLIYEKTQSKGPMTGIASPKSPFFLLPNDLLSTNSNVGQPGKWMYRIDDGITTCPAGAEHPPMCDKDCPPGRYGFSCQSSCHCALGFPCDPATGVCANGCAPGWTGLNCDQDVDECATGMIQCAPNAECVNSVGGYQCTCRKGYSGDGKQCTLVERCYARYGRSCSTSGSCEEFPDGPRCVCARGYRGDGFLCTAQTPIHSSVEDITSLMKNERQRSDNTDIDVGDHPFVMKDWQTSARTSPRPMTTTRGRPGLQPCEEGFILIVALEQSVISVLFLIGPAVLCAIWVILVIVVIAVCCRNKHRYDC